MGRDADLNDVGVLRRREIEARILSPVVEALAREFGRERVLEVVRRDVTGIAAALEPWTRDGALEMRLLRQTDRELHFDVTRCRYAEMYRALGLPELGAVLSCNRDFALGSGFN